MHSGDVKIIVYVSKYIPKKLCFQLQWYKGKSVKKGFFSGFCEYFLIGVSYGPNFFIDVKNYVGRVF